MTLAQSLSRLSSRAPQKVILELRLPDKGLGPLEREMLKDGVGHFFLDGISDLSIAGTWEITLNCRRGRPPSSLNADAVADPDAEVERSRN